METSESRGTRRDLLRRTSLGMLTIGAATLPLSRIFPAAAQVDGDAPPPGDDDIAAFAESMELVLVEAYGSAVATGKLSAGRAQTATMFAGHHAEHAAALGGEAGTKATGRPNARLLAMVGDQLRNARTESAVLQIAYDLETSAAATYLFALGALTGAGTLKLCASILPVESQHAAVVGQALGQAVEEYVPTFENQDQAIDLTRFPTVVTTTTSQ